jgi:hypothetical protein
VAGCWHKGKKYLALVLGLIALASVFVTSACNSSEAGGNGGTGITQDESQLIARDFVIKEPTFAFDGMLDTLNLVETITLRCPYCWEFVYEFDCAAAGYGDRTDVIVAQVITPHSARVTVQEGVVTSAAMDGKWDMIEQKLIENSA